MKFSGRILQLLISLIFVPKTPNFWHFSKIFYICQTHWIFSSKSIICQCNVHEINDMVHIHKNKVQLSHYIEDCNNYNNITNPSPQKFCTIFGKNVQKKCSIFSNNYLSQDNMLWDGVVRNKCLCIPHQVDMGLKWKISLTLYLLHVLAI